MKEIEFERYSVNGRKDLLHFVEDIVEKDIYTRIAENTGKWIDELNIISNMLTREGLVCAGMNSPPINDPDFKKLGNNIFLYRGKEIRLRGLWVKKKVNKTLSEATGQSLEELANSCFGWSQYPMGSSASIKINKEFLDIPIETFLPENFENTGKLIREKKRPIIQFKSYHNGKEINIFAKGSCITHWFYYPDAKPKFRLTKLSGVHNQSSETEMKKTLEMARIGINVPNIVGYYKGSVEEFLFLEEVVGDDPGKVLERNKHKIIQTDAEMLAKLCLAGYRKQGFSDFDDKIFDGERLYLIDVDECVDLYGFLNPNYRDVLLNPKDNSRLKAFRKMQRNVFKGMLKDTLFNYRNNLTSTKDDMIEYINKFYDIMGWKVYEREVSKLTTFEKHYITHDTLMSEMSHSD